MENTLGKIIADFNAVLSLKVAVGATTATISTATDDDGVPLPAGNYFFTIDRNSSSKEYIYCALSGTSLSSIQSVSRQGVLTTGFARSHRAKTATVEITDFAVLKKMLDLLDGSTRFDASIPLGYDGNAIVSNGNDFATKDYADGLTYAGTPDASTTVKGASRLSTSPTTTLGTATITIATPGVVTLANHGLTLNDSVEFSTTGSLPTGVVGGSKYYVISSGLTTNSFQISATLGGTAINTTGSQSGTHTLYKTTPTAVSASDPLYVGLYQKPGSAIQITSTSQAPLPIVNPGMDGNGSITTSGWLGGNAQSGWAAGIVGTGAVSFDNGKLKLETLGSGSYIEARNTDGGYHGVTAQSLAISPNTKYIIEFDFVTQYVSGDSNDGFTVNVLTQSAPGVSAGEHNVFSPVKTSLNGHHRAEFTTLATAAYMNISPIIYGHSGAGTLQMKAWIDNITIYKKSEGVETSYLLGTSGKVLGFNPDGSPAVVNQAVSKLSNIPQENDIARHPPSYYSKQLSYEFRTNTGVTGALNIPNTHSEWFLLRTETGWNGGKWVTQTAIGDYFFNGSRGTDIFVSKSIDDNTWAGWSPIGPDTLLNTADELTLGSGQSTIFSHTIPADWLKVGDTLDLTLNMSSQLASTSHNIGLELGGIFIGGWISPVSLGTNEQYHAHIRIVCVVTGTAQQKTLTQATWKRTNTGGSLIANDVVYAPGSPITVTTKDISTALTIALKDYGTQNGYSQYRWTLKKS